MILGKWNKSVILSYIGLLSSILGIIFCMKVQINYAVICMMVTGLCDLFDGTVARRCKRTKEEKQFGIELDSLIDVFDFIAFPIVFFYAIGFQEWYYYPLFCFYGIMGIARLAHFNTIVDNNNKPVPFYHGLPVTYAALIFPLAHFFCTLFFPGILLIVIGILIFVVTIFYIIDVPVPKPKLLPSVGLLILAIVLTIFYLWVL
ncbi:MAG: CDP-alcohol phosphatidyltransferase family protein [Bacilli bacterium]|nr:CDP-alcohol phosphatidyltransferase family protein [Bacilli bacterium]